MNEDSIDLVGETTQFVMEQRRFLEAFVRSTNDSYEEPLTLAHAETLLLHFQDAIRSLALLEQAERMNSDPKLGVPLQELRRLTDEYDRLLTRLLARISKVKN